ncbi:MAG: alpha/beta hydrolase [Lactobacillaceae bacterium]|jgi:fermentation-respiration switch protein FrsA (DUF1100 family)|nr:alpha/beta hydrolase [Lactobacillaceae bacterium]
MRIIQIIFGIVTVLFLILNIVSVYFLHVALARIPAKKEYQPIYKKNEAPYSYQQKWNTYKPELWTIETADHLKLVADYLPAEKQTNKTVVLAHGWHISRKYMGTYGEMFHQMGYNVLVPDERGAGQSDGKWYGFGWQDRLDYLKWFDLINKKIPNGQIAMLGISMGAAATLMTSGEKLPENVKALIADSAFTSVKDQFTEVLKKSYHLPAFPIINYASFLSKHIVGYSFDEASTIKQVQKNKLPILFIAGDSDSLIPYQNTEKLYQADPNSNKEIWITKNSEHVQSFHDYNEEYVSHVKNFLDKYFK